MTTDQMHLSQPAELHRHCRRCGRKLKQERAMRLGYGRVCLAKAVSEAREAKEQSHEQT